MDTRSITPFLLAAILSLAVVGCESSDDAGSDASGTTSSQTTQAGNSKGDAVDFASLNWTMGGFNGSGATLSSPTIQGLNISGGSMSYSWAGPNLSAWGLSSSSAGALACLFVQKSDGTWVGGKFDWISSSRTSRDLSHCFSKYNGWSLRDVPNPCKAAFVIVSKDGSKRSNVISATWTR